MNTRSNHILELVPGRIDRLLGELKGSIWHKRQDLCPAMGPLNDPPVELREAKRQPMRNVEPGEIISPADPARHGALANRNCPWAQRWFRVDIPAAKEREQGRRVLFWQAHGETTVYRNDVPWAGIDPGHEYCTLPDEACELWIDAGLWQTAIWIERLWQYAPDERGFRFDGAWISLRDEQAWEAWHDLNVLHELSVELIRRDGYEIIHCGRQKAFEQLHPRARRLLRQLDEACDVFDRSGLQALSTRLKEIYADHPAPEPLLRHATHGHSHLDLVWLWPKEVGIRKGIHTSATALRLLDRYPEFQFMMTQPWLFEEIEQRAPELLEHIREQSAGGRWEFTGGLLVESDITLPCLEGLIRALTYGQEAFQRLRGGEPSRVCYLPDVFGFNGQFPQLLQLAGIEGFYTTKLNWNRITAQPYDSFVWQALDGTAVVSQMKVAGGLKVAAGFDAQRNYRQADVHDESYGWFGLGDGGGGPREEDCEKMRRYAKLADAPAYTYSSAEGFFERLKQRRDRLPVFRGELYFEYHRGCYTTQAQVKHLFRRAEVALQTHEALRVVSGGQPLGAEAWRPLIFAQFHDAVPGSSIRPVFDELTAELAALAESHLTAAAEELAGEGGDSQKTVFNAAGCTRRLLLTLDPGIGASLDGHVLDTQASEDGTLVQVELPPLGSAVLDMHPCEPSTPAREATPDVLDNGTVRVTFDSAGRAVSIKSDKGELLSGPGEFVLYDDVPAKFEAWDIDQAATRDGRGIGMKQGLKLVESGPLRWTLRGQLDLPGESTGTVEYVLERGSAHLRVNVDVDWQASRKLLRYEAPTAFCGSHAWFGCPGGAVRRPQLPGHVQTEMMWEVPGSRWAAVCDEPATHGLAILTEAKYGFSARDGRLGVSLLRSPNRPGASSVEAPAAGIDIGHHRMRFAVGPFRLQHGPGEPNTQALAETMFMPVVTASGSTPLTSPFALEEAGTLIASWLAPSADGYEIRLHESAGSAGSATIRFDNSAEHATLVDFLGNVQETLSLDESNRVEIPYRSWQILSVRVQRGGD